MSKPKISGKLKEMEYRRVLVARLYHAGFRRQQEIADQLKIQYDVEVNRSTISRDLTVLESRWRESSNRDYDQVKLELLAETEALKSEYYAAWERSKEDKEVVRQEGTRVGKEQANVQKITITKTEQIGSTQYLNGVQWCIDKFIDIYGLEAPKKAQIESDVEVTHVLTQDERKQKIIDLLGLNKNDDDS